MMDPELHMQLMRLNLKRIIMRKVMKIKQTAVL